MRPVISIINVAKHAKKALPFVPLAILLSLQHPVFAGSFDFPTPTKDTCRHKQQVIDEMKDRYIDNAKSINPLYAWVFQSRKKLFFEYEQAEAAFISACEKTLMENCSALATRSPDSDPSWQSMASLHGLPEQMRRKSSPCVDTWYRLLERRNGFVLFEVTKTDRRPKQINPRWMTPDRLEIQCSSMQAKVGENWLPVRRGSLGWIGAQVYC